MRQFSQVTNNTFVSHTHTHAYNSAFDVASSLLCFFFLSMCESFFLIILSQPDIGWMTPPQDSKSFITVALLHLPTPTNCLPCTQNPTNAVSVALHKEWHAASVARTLFGMGHPKCQGSRAWNVNLEMHSTLFRLSLSGTTHSRMALLTHWQPLL